MPTLIQVSSGMTATSDAMGDPHVGQKLRDTGCPLSPVSWKVLSVPLGLKADSAIATRNEKADPVCFWQCLQWQTPTVTGSPVTS